MSRKNTPIVAVPHIEEELNYVLQDHPGLILDGELYNHDYRYNLNTIVSIVRKANPTPAELLEASVMQYWVYDIAGEYKGENVESWSLDKRLDLLEDRIPLSTKTLMVTLSSQVTSFEDIDRRYSDYLKSGFEGQMVRRNGPYARNSRSADLLKRKEEDDKEFKLLDIVEGEGNRSGMAGYAVVQLDNGLTCDSNITGDRAFLRNLLANKADYIGGQVTVKYNGVSPLGRLTNPRVVAVFEKDRDV
jgi:DNA ligase-1